jgi:Ca2+-binding EF-hand superfamily protein
MKKEGRFWGTTTIVLATLMIALTAGAQDTDRRGKGVIEERFNELDANIDGKLSAEELGDPELFKAADKDTDGFVTLEEAREYYRNRRKQRNSAEDQPAAANPTSLDFTFQKDYSPGTKDASGRWSGGTETMRLIAHGGKLFTSLGYWTDVPYGKAKGDEPWTAALTGPSLNGSSSTSGHTRRWSRATRRTSCAASRRFPTRRAAPARS